MLGGGGGGGVVNGSYELFEEVIGLLEGHPKLL